MSARLAMRVRFAVLLAAAPIACFSSIDLARIDAGDFEPEDSGAVSCDAGGACVLTCPEGQVEVRGASLFCVDTAPVTRRAYAAFLAAHGGDLGGQPAACRWNTDLTPTSDWPPPLGTEDRPVADVDWCDARAFCVARGAALCGAPSGGPTSLERAADPASSAWALACTSASIAPSASFTEWIDACATGPGASGANDDCAVIGGTPADGGASCVPAAGAERRGRTDPARGFRCCLR